MLGLIRICSMLRPEKSKSKTEIRMADVAPIDFRRTPFIGTDPEFRQQITSDNLQRSGVEDFTLSVCLHKRGVFLAQMSRSNEAISEVKLAESLDPLSLPVQ